jgi:hypothetical protein
VRCVSSHCRENLLFDHCLLQSTKTLLVSERRENSGRCEEFPVSLVILLPALQLAKARGDARTEDVFITLIKTRAGADLCWRIRSHM